MSFNIKPPGSRDARGATSARPSKKGVEPQGHRRVSEAEEKHHPGSEDALSRPSRGPEERSFDSKNLQQKPGGALAGALARPQSAGTSSSRRLSQGPIAPSGHDPALRQLANRALAAFQHADGPRREAAVALFSALDR